MGAFSPASASYEDTGAFLTFDMPANGNVIIEFGATGEVNALTAGVLSHLYLAAAVDSATPSDADAVHWMHYSSSGPGGVASSSSKLVVEFLTAGTHTVKLYARAYGGAGSCTHFWLKVLMP